MMHNKAITTTMLDTLCFILDCEVSDILRYKPDETKQAAHPSNSARWTRAGPSAPM